MRISRQLLLAVGMASLAFAALPLSAQTERSGGGANAQMLLQMQQLTAERTALQSDNAKLKADLDALRKERDALKSSDEAKSRRDKSYDTQVATLMHDRERLEAEATQQKERMQELIAKFRETTATLRDVETQGEAAKQSLASRDGDLKTCVDANAKLYALNDEILQRMEKRSFWSSVAPNEPFTQLKRVQLENIVDAYRESARDARLAPAGAAH
jgi:chromosome segregation ATPase